MILVGGYEMNIRTNNLIGSAAMRRGAAAAHLGISPSHFDKLVREKIMPEPRIAGSVKLWIREELETALLEMPTEGVTPCGEYDLKI